LALKVLLTPFAEFNGGSLAGLQHCFGPVSCQALVLSTCKTLHAQSGVCPVTVPESASATLNVPLYRTGRPLVEGDYVVIEYDASQDKNDPNSNITSWTDYNRIFDFHGQNNRMHIIGPNGSFLPVIYAKEEIAVPLQSVTTEQVGLSLGVGFDLSVFSTIFGTESTAAATMP
jgi:hypothetical protein